MGRMALWDAEFVGAEAPYPRVLHCCPHLSGGGAEQQLGYLARYWAEKGQEVHIACLKGTHVPEHLRRKGIVIHELPHMGNLDPVLIFRLLKLLRELEPDLVQTWLLQMDVLGGVAAAMAGVPWIIREPVNGDFWRGVGIRKVYRLARMRTAMREWLGKRADAVVSNSAGGDEYWSSYVPASRRFVVANAVPLEEIVAQAPLDLDARRALADGPVIFAAGRLEHQKNFSVLIEAFKRILPKIAATLVIAGRGSQRTSLEALSDNLNISSHIRMLGHISSIWPTLKSVDLFVSISKFEGRPNTVLEAMACGCPLVLSDIPAHREIADESSALLIKNFEDVESVASAIFSILSAPELAQKRARVAQERATRYSISRMAAEYQRVYHRILQSR